MNRLKELRKEKQITQSEIAKFIGISQNSYSYWENGKVKIDNESIIKLANYFNVSVDYLLGREVPTLAEKAAGAAATRKESITPIEDELLYNFRQVGKKHGEETQKAIITMIEKML